MPEVFAHASLALLVLGLVVAGLGVPIPEDPLLLLAGALAHRGPPASALVALAAVYAAVITADCGLYFLAQRFGDGLLSRRPLRWIATPTRRGRVRELLGRYGAQAIFFGRHLAGVRAVLFVIAGAEGVPFRKFLLFDALAALLTVPLVFGLGYAFSNHLAQVEAGVARAEHWLLAAAGVVVLGGLAIWSLKGAGFGKRA